MKYRPEFPGRFGSIEDARSFGQVFFPWYNDEHRHSGIGYLTPAAVHAGRLGQLQAERAAVLAEAHTRHPERFVNGAPHPVEVPTEVWINRPAPTTVEVATRTKPGRKVPADGNQIRLLRGVGGSPKALAQRSRVRMPRTSAADHGAGGPP